MQWTRSGDRGGDRRAFGPRGRRIGFGPSGEGASGFTRHPCPEGQLQLVVLPPGRHPGSPWQPAAMGWQPASRRAQPRIRGTTQTSRGKVDRLPRAPAESSAQAFASAACWPRLFQRSDDWPPGQSWLWTSRSSARSSALRSLLSGSCPSGRGFAPHCLQTPPHDDALVLR
jgi:hypothetical protein